MNRECNATKGVLTRNGLRYCPVVLSANGRIKPDWVYVTTDTGKSLQELHPEGSYYIEWRENGRRRRLSVGGDAADATAQRLRKEAELNARNHGVAVVPPAAKNGLRKLSTAIAEYLEEIQLSKKPKTHAAYELTLRYFQESCPKAHIEDVDHSRVVIL